MMIQFDIWMFNPPTSDPTQSPPGAASSPADAGTPYTLNFQNDTPTLAPHDNCAGVPTAYQSGDRAIVLDTAAFSLDYRNATGANIPIDALHAPPSAVLIAGLQAPDSTPFPVLDPSDPWRTLLAAFSFPAPQQAPAEVAVHGLQAVGGFENGSSYQLEFLVRDNAGLVAAPPNPPESCGLRDVQTGNGGSSND
jgi:hypothetical protein